MNAVTARELTEIISCMSCILLGSWSFRSSSRNASISACSSRSFCASLACTASSCPSAASGTAHSQAASQMLFMHLGRTIRKVVIQDSNRIEVVCEPVQWVGVRCRVEIQYTFDGQYELWWQLVFA